VAVPEAGFVVVAVPGPRFCQQEHKFKLEDQNWSLDAQGATGGAFHSELCTAERELDVVAVPEPGFAPRHQGAEQQGKQELDFELEDQNWSLDAQGATGGAFHSELCTAERELDVVAVPEPSFAPDIKELNNKANRSSISSSRTRIVPWRLREPLGAHSTPSYAAERLTWTSPPSITPPRTLHTTPAPLTGHYCLDLA
jgi:hypothetical protein